MCSDNVKVILYRSHCSSLWWKYKDSSSRKFGEAFNNTFHMLSRLPRDCKAINKINKIIIIKAGGMFVVNNVVSCPAFVRKLLFGFYKIVN